MNKETCKDGLQVARLDRTQPPPGYMILRAVDGFGFTDAAGTVHVSSMDAHGHGWRKDTAVARAWANYEREHDPPGMWVESGGFAEDDVVFWGVGHERDDDNATASTSHEAASAAAWVWYWQRVALSARVDAEVVVLIEHGYGAMSNHVPTPRARVADALRPMLTMADDDDARQETAAEVERLFAEGRLTFEGDPPIELAAVDAWPRALTWPDDQVATVERWLAEGGEVPEVLHV